MEINCKELIEQNIKLIDKFWNEYHNQKERLIENDFDMYKAHLQSAIYEQIILSYEVVGKNNYSITEHEYLPILSSQFIELSEIFFDRLEAEQETYWQTLEIHRKEHNYGLENAFKEPKEFTKERINQFIKKSLISISLKRASKGEFENNDYFDVALKWGSGKLDEVYYRCNNNGSATARELFKLENKTKKQIENILGIINATTRKVTPEKPQSNPHKDLRIIIKKDDDFFDSAVRYLHYNDRINNPIFEERKKIILPD